jgi:hypothetical protein
MYKTNYDNLVLKLTQAVKILTCILNVSGSNTGQVTVYRD